MANMNLEEKIERLLLLAEKNDAARQVQNLASKLCYYQEVGAWEKRWDLLADKTPGVTVEIAARGVFEGKKNAYETLVTHEKIFETSHAEAIRAEFPELEFETIHTGMLETSILGTPIIEVADDLKTAKGTWMAVMAMAKARKGEYGQPHAGWVWWRYSIDFVKEDQVWKIWHLVANPVFIANYTEDWVETSKHLPPVPKTYDEEWQSSHEVKGVSQWPQPDRGTTPIYNPYRLDRTPRLYPDLPEPYETFET